MSANKFFLVTTVPRLLFWALLTPLLISSSGIVCTPTGDTRLASLELEVFGANRIAFDPALRVYDVGIPPGTMTVTVRAEAMDTQARLTWYVPDGEGMLASGALGVGSGQVTVDLPPDGFSLYVGVFPPGRAVNTYIMTFAPCSSDCNDGDDCTADVCNPANDACSNPDEVDGVACDFFSGVPGMCAAGMCEDATLCAGVDCSDGQECTMDICDPFDGSCSNPNEVDGAACDFGGLPGMCAVGVCEDAMLCAGIVCDDANECTTEVCDPIDGSCSYTDELTGTTCDDGFGPLSGACDGAGACQDICGFNEPCPDPGVQCQVASCDPVDGACGFVNATNGLSCDFVGFPGVCNAGTCDDAMLCAGVDCDDINPCTVDICDPENGLCDHSNVTEGTTCDYGELPGVCTAGACDDAMLCADAICDDGIDCTAGTCDPMDGSCSYTDETDGTSCDRVGGNGFCSGLLCVCVPDGSELCDGVDNDCNGLVDDQAGVASVTVSPETWDANRIGHRQQLTATAWNACSNPIPDAQSTWVSSNTNVARVDASGLVTAVSSGTAVVTATADGEAATTTVTVTSEVESAVLDLCRAAGLGDVECRAELASTLYTVWFARSDDAPALLVDGELKVAKDMYCLHHDLEEWMVCPAAANFPPNASYEEPNNDPNDNDYNLLPGYDPESPDPLGTAPPGTSWFPNPPDPTTPWSYPNVAKFQWEGDRIGILSDMSGGTGTFRVVDRHEEWIVQSFWATDFQLEGNRMAVVTDVDNLRTVWVKDGNTSSAGWTNVESRGSPVRQFQLKNNYIAVLRENGLFRVKEGIIGAWQALNGAGVTEFAMEIVPGSGVRIGAVVDDGTVNTVWVKEGISPGGWTDVDSRASAVRQFEMKGDYIGVLYENGLFRVKQGISGTWYGTGSGVTEFAMEILPNSVVRIGELLDTGAFTVKDGITGVPTTVYPTGVKRIQLQENYIGALLDDGTLRVKQGVFGPWRNTTEAYGPGVTQFRLVVDVPVPPERTTPAIYAHEVGECGSVGEQFGSHRCFPTRTDWAPLQDRPGPTDYYGYFAGANLPGKDPEWDWAVANGPMDPMDALTMHHDAAYGCPCGSDPEPSASWYPESKEVLTQHLCVVRYGLEYAKLTRNGTPIDIPTSGQADWLGLEDLYHTIYFGVGSYRTGSNVLCPPLALDTFAENTKAKHNPAPPVDCQPLGGACLLGNNANCCSGSCFLLQCRECRGEGTLCVENGDCCSGSCSSYLLLSYCD